MPFLHLPDFIAKKPAGSGISVLCRCCCDSSSSVSAPHNRRKSGLRGFSQAGCQWPVAASPPPPDPPQEEQPPPADPAPAAAAHIPAASTQRTLLGLGCSPPAGGRGPVGRGPAGWSSVSNRLRRPLPPACSHTDAAPASGTQRLNTPAAQTTGGGNEGVQVISETLGEVYTLNKGRGRGARRKKAVKKVW